MQTVSQLKARLARWTDPPTIMHSIVSNRLAASALMLTSAVLGWTLGSFAPASRPGSSPDPSTEAPAATVHEVERNRLREIGLAVLDRFQETWNARDTAVWTQSLHFPHVRPSAGNFSLSSTQADYIRNQRGVFERILAAGWHRSQWNSRRVLHISRDKMHIAGQYSRYRENGETISSQQVTYIVTRQGEHWGIQSRFGSGFLPSGERSADNREAARTAVQAYFAALNSLDPESWADTMHFPQVRLGSSALGFWKTRADFLSGVEPGRQRTWSETRIDAIKVYQIGPSGANLSVRYSRLNAGGEALAAYDAVFLATLCGNRWAVQSHSTYGP